MLSGIAPERALLPGTTRCTKAGKLRSGGVLVNPRESGVHLHGSVDSLFEILL
jgi:hypothetical protein